MLKPMNKKYELILSKIVTCFLKLYVQVCKYFINNKSMSLSIKKEGQSLK